VLGWDNWRVALHRLGQRNGYALIDRLEVDKSVAPASNRMPTRHLHAHRPSCSGQQRHRP
jgi:hypothetical protein